jgi:hypothetical protein
MSTVARDPGDQQPDARDRGPAAAALAAGGTFATAVGGVLLAAGRAGVDNGTTRIAIAAVCFIAALTMFTAAVMHRRR